MGMGMNCMGMGIKMWEWEEKTLRTVIIKHLQQCLDGNWKLITAFP